MLELTALSMIIILYVVPLNISLYNLSKETVKSLFSSNSVFAADVFYIIYIALIFMLVYIIISALSNKEEYTSLISRYKKGTQSINRIGSGAILLLLLLQLFLQVLNVRNLVLGLLCMIFVFNDFKYPVPKISIKYFKKQ